MKKSIFLLIVFTVITGMVFAGGGNQGSPAGGSGSSGPVSDDLSKTLELTWFGYNIPGNLPQDGSILQREFEKRYNVKFINVPVDNGNLEQVNLLLATGLEFDFWSWNTRTAQICVEQGLIRPLSEDMFRRYAPGLVSQLESANPNWKNIGSYEGTFYGVPMINATNYSPLGLAVQTAWLNNLGVTNLPKTLDELETLMERFVNDDPDKNGSKDTYALSLFADSGGYRFLNPYLFASYGVNLGHWGVDTDGSPKSWAIQDEYRQALARMSQWWAKGLYDPELITSSRNVNMERFAQGKTGGYFYADWSLVPSPNSGTVGWYLLQRQNPQTDPNTISTIIPPVSGPKGTITARMGMSLTGAVNYFGRNTSDEKVIRILRMLNDVVSDKDVYLLKSFGFEGTHFTLNPTGQVVVNPEWSSADKLTELGKDRFGPHVFMPLEMYPYIIDEYWYRGYMAIKDYSCLPIHIAQLFSTADDVEYGTAVGTIQNEYFWKVVTGEWNVDSTWNNYIRDWTAAGGQRILDAKKKLAVDLGLN